MHAERDSLKTEQQAKVKTNTDATVEAKARGIGEGQIKRYWRAKEEGRKAVRGMYPCALFMTRIWRRRGMMKLAFGDHGADVFELRYF